MLGRLRLLSACLAVMTLVCAAPAHSSPPSSNWTREGRDQALKLAFKQAFKETLRGGKFIANTDSWGIDPLVTAATTEGTPADKLQAWLIALGQAGVQMAWPQYKMTLAGGKIFIGSVFWTTESMLSAAHDEQVQAILTGKGTGGLLDRMNNVMAETPFMDFPLVRNKGITPENIGRWVPNEAELRKLWLAYVADIRTLYGPGNAQAAEQEVWPQLDRMWRAQRVEIVSAEIVSQLDRAMRQAEQMVAQDQAGGGDAASGDFAGTYTNAAGTSTIKVSGGASVTAREVWASGGRNGTNDWSNCQASGVTLKCNWTGKYMGDPDKTADRSGTVTVSIQDGHMTGTYFENEPVFHWNVAPYPSAMHQGAQWQIDVTRQGGG